MPPLTLYIHLPWCVRKCPYCDFNSHALRDELPETAYVEALARDLDFACASLDGERPIEAVFFGGGTPSLFSPDAIGRILEHAGKRLGFAEDVEITLEANPGTIEHGRFSDYRAAGVNRVSLGVQSFDEVQLQTLGRIHDRRAAVAAAEELHAAGIANFNLDLMFALPGQTVQGALADIEQALMLEPAHISHYELTLEPNTLFAVRPPAGIPDEDQAADIAVACRARLAEAGFERYEISAFARPGRRCRHNLNYWSYGDYLGIGAGAHGKLTLADGRILRSARCRHPKDYLERAGHAGAIVEQREVSPEERVFEYMLNRSRLVEGGSAADFSEYTGLEAGRLAPGLAKAEQLGLVRREGDAWQPTPRGFELLNELQALFLPAAP